MCSVHVSCAGAVSVLSGGAGNECCGLRVAVSEVCIVSVCCHFMWYCKYSSCLLTSCMHKCTVNRCAICAHTLMTNKVDHSDVCFSWPQAPP